MLPCCSPSIRVWSCLAAFVLAGVLPLAAADKAASEPLQKETTRQAQAVVAAGAVGEDASRVVQTSAEEDLGNAEPGVEQSRETEQAETISDAQRIGRLQRSIEKDQEQLEQLRSGMKAADEEFALAGRIFNKVDERFAEAKEKLEEARTDGATEKITALTTELADRQEKLTLCKERFDLALESRKGLQQQIEALKEKLAQDAAALERLTGDSEEDAPEPLPEAAVPTSHPAETSPSPPAPVVGPSALGLATPVAAKAEPAAPADAPIGQSPRGLGAAAQASLLPEGPDERQALADVQLARDEASRQQAAASEAREEVVAIEKRQQSLDRNIALEQQLRDAARKQSDNALRAAREFQEDYRQKSEASAPAEVLIKIGQRIQSSELRVEKAREEVKSRSARLDELHDQRHALMSDRIAALQQADTRERAADEARRKVATLENPFSRRNVTRWVFSHGPNVLVILACFLVLRLVVRVVCRRVVVLMTHKGSGSRKERENRAHTIVSVFHNAATVLCYGGSTLMILEECEVPVGPLLGGAAVFGLAVAFGSQNLIRDYFYGFVILLENQYGINDVVRIGEITGKVERITLRMTVIRDMDGVNFIPNGRIESVKNLTHGWSQAVLEISVSYKEDVDHVMDVLMDLGRELRKDPQFSEAILEDPTMLGVEQLGDSSVQIKFFLKTKPLEQWGIKREMLRRIKRRFDELAIEIPFPQRVVNHRYLTVEGQAEEAHADGWPQRKSA